MALDLCLSRVRTGVAAMGQDCNYELDITKLGRKRVLKNSLGWETKSVGGAAQPVHLILFFRS